MTQGNTLQADVRLDQVEVHGYRSCLSTTFEPNRELSALIGVNGAGKTNVLQAIRLLHARRGPQNRKALEELSQSAEAEVTAWFRVSDKRIGLKMRFSIVESSRRTDELVTVSEAWNLYSITNSKAWKSLPPIDIYQDMMNNPEYIDRLILFYPPNSSGRHGIENFDTVLITNESVFQVVSAIDAFRKGIAYYSASQFTDPTRCPSSFEVNEDGRLAEMYSAVPVHLKFLHDLYRLKKSNKLLYDEYCRFISRNQLGLVSRITWKEIELSSNTAEVRSGGGVKKVRKRKTLVIPKVQVGSAYITFNQLSEGTFKTLALAFYIITDSSQFLMVEEPEVCVHHGLLSRVVATLKSYAKSKQTVISTHSDLLVDELEPENIFVVEMNKNGTQVKQLNKWLDKAGKEALHTYLAESGPLGDYWRSGGLS